MVTRADFSAPTKREAYARSRGRCECHRLPEWPFAHCGRALGEGDTFYEHIDPAAFSGRNDLDNCAVLTRTCWRLRTDTHNIPRVAKSNRQRDRARNIKPHHFRPLPGTVRSGWKHFMNGGWMRR